MTGFTYFVSPRGGLTGGGGSAQLRRSLILQGWIRD